MDSGRPVRTGGVPRLVLTLHQALRWSRPLPGGVSQEPGLLGRPKKLLRSEPFRAIG
jgi:hypothetical protein